MKLRFNLDKTYLYKNINLLSENMAKDYIEDKLKIDVFPKIDKFLDQSDLIQKIYQESNNFFNKQEEEELWKRVDNIIKYEEEILEQTHLIKTLKQSELNTKQKISSRLISEIENLIKDLNHAIGVCQNTINFFIFKKLITKEEIDNISLLKFGKI